MKKMFSTTTSKAKQGRSVLQKSVERFFNEHQRLPNRAKSILVACSGGSDSVALVWTLRGLSQRLPYRFELGHVNHQIRGGESEKDAQFVQNLSRKLGWAYHLSIQPVKAFSSGNLEEIARDKRYDAFQEICQESGCDMTITAHTLDDQVETIFMNIIRGTGPDGLSGIKPLRKLANGLLVGRPLLDVSKDDIRSFLSSSRLAYRTDRSNKNPNFLRNWLRQKVMPLIEKRSPGYKHRMARLAELMGKEQSYWSDLMIEMKIKLLAPYGDGALLDFKRLLRYAPAVQRRFLRHVLGGDLLSFDAVERLRSWMSAPPTGGRRWQLRKGWIAERLSKSTGSPSTSLFWLHRSRTKHFQTPKLEETLFFNEKV